MKTVEEIIEYLESEIEWARKCAQGYLSEYMKGDEAFFSRDKCLEYHNSYLAQNLKLQQVLKVIKGDEEKGKSTKFYKVNFQAVVVVIIRLLPSMTH